MAADKMLKEAMKAGKLLIGRRSVLRALKSGSLSAVLLPSNCPADIARDIEYYKKVSSTEVVEFGGNSAQLGEACGKPFKIAIVGIEK
jgi:large subunit ribosomal protein L30e